MWSWSHLKILTTVKKRKLRWCGRDHISRSLPRWRSGNWCGRDHISRSLPRWRSGNSDDVVVVTSQDPYHGEETETQMMWSWSYLKILTTVKKRQLRWCGRGHTSRFFGMAKTVWATSWENLFLPYAYNKDADQPAHPHSLISAFVIRCLESIIPPLFFISDISRDQGQEEGKKYMYSKVRRPKVVPLVHSSVRPIVTLAVIFENSFVEARRIILKVSTIQRSNVFMRKPSKIALFMEEG